MAKQVIKLGLEFDTKSAIASYRQLVSEMQKGGADPKAIKQFTAAIEKAETELAQLAAEGSTGFTDSKGIEQYQKKVLKTVTSMQQLALRMQEFSKSGENFPLSEVKKLEAEIGKLKKQIVDAQKAAKDGLVKSLVNNGGFTKKEAEAIAETVKTQNELIARLEQEKRLRDEIRKAAEEPAKKAKSSIQDKAIARTTSGSEVVMEAVGMKGKKGVKEAREAVAAAIQQGIRDGWSAEDVKKKAIESLQASNLSDAVKKNIVQGLEAGFDTETVRKYLEAVDKKIAANPAVKKYNTANESYGKIANGSIENYSQFITNSEAAAKAQQDLADAQSRVDQAAINSATSQKKLSDAAGQEANKAAQAADGFMQMSDAQKNSLKSTEQLEGGFNRLADRLKYMFGFTAMFNKLRQVIRSTFNDIQELDKAYASIAYVTNETVGDLWATYGEYAGMAEKLGQSTADVIKASAIYRQQGLDTAEALELTTDTMKLATIAGNDYSTATQEMTAALRGFKMEMDEGSHVSDVYSELAAHAAASVDDIAQAMSRTASIANSAGMSFENTSAFLTQMIETTQESAENIGTSMKTIIARFTELKENVAGTADSEFDDLEFNKVDKALKSVGVSLKDTSGQFRNLDDVFLELSSKWDTLDRNTQRYIATVAAGSRQQSRFIALMDNYDRTIELIETAADSEGKADEQFAKAADTIEFKLNAIKTKWEEFKLSIMGSDFVKGILNQVNSLMDNLKNVKMPQVALFGTFAILAAKKFILSFINTIKKSATTFSQIGKLVTNSILKKMPKFKFDVDIAALEQKLNEAKAKVEEATTKKDYSMTLILKTESDLQQTQTEIENTIEELKKLALEGKGDSAEADALRDKKHQLERQEAQLNETLTAQNKVLNKNEEELAAAKSEAKKASDNLDEGNKKNELSVQKATAATQLMTQTLQGAVAALSGYASGLMTGEQALSTFALSTTGAIGQMVLSLTSMTVSSAIATGGLKAVGAALKEVGATLLAPPFIIIMGIAAGIAAIAGAAALVAHISAQNAANNKSTADQLQAQQEQLQTLKAQNAELTSQRKNQEKELKDTKELKKKYEELSSLHHKTTEQQEEYGEIVNELKDNYPELVRYYNETTGELQLQANAWDTIIQKQEESLELLRQQEFSAKNATTAKEIQIGRIESRSDFSNKTGLGDDLVKNIDSDAEAIGLRNKIQSQLKNAVSYGSISKSSDGKLQVIRDGNGGNYSLNIDIHKLAEAYQISLDDSDAMAKLQKEIMADEGNKYLALIDDGITQLHIDNENLRKQEVENYAKNFSQAYASAHEDATAGQIAVAEAFARTALKESELTTISSQDYIQNIKENSIGNSNIGFYNQLGGARAGASDNELSSWETINGNRDWEIEGLTDYGIASVGDVIDLLTEIEGSEAAAKEYYEAHTEGADKQEELFDHIINGAISKRMGDRGNDLIEKYSQAYTDSNGIEHKNGKYGQITEFYDKIAEGGFTESELNDLEKQIDTLFAGVAKTSFKDALLNSEKEALLAAQETAAQYGLGTYDEKNGSSGQQNMTSGELNAYVSKIKEIGKSIGGDNGEEMAKAYAEGVNKLLSSQGIADNMLDDFFNTIDFSQINPLNAEQFKQQSIQSLIDTYNISAEKAEDIYQKAFAIAAEKGFAKVDEINAIQVQTYINSLKEMEDAIDKNMKAFSDFIGEDSNNLDITAEKYKDMLDAAEELSKVGINLDIDQFTTYNEELGTYVLNAEALNTALEKSFNLSKADLEQSRKINSEKLASLRKQHEAQEISDEQYAAEVQKITDANLKLDEAEKTMERINRQNAEALKYANSIEAKIEKIGNKLSNLSTISSQLTSDGFLDTKSIEALAEFAGGKGNIGKYFTNGSVDPLTMFSALKQEAKAQVEAATTEYDRILATAQYNEIVNQEAEYIENSTKKTDEKTDKLKSLADAQQDVTDKQKALNEAIADYNRLLYGSENRQSGLDLLYNYKEAISAFSDEMSRAQEIMEDATSINEASAALSRYTNAAHQRLAYMQAEGTRYNAGLEVRRNQLLSGATSYTNELTGNTTTINFGDYVKYNADTGLMAIDQKLIQDAKIADEWKDYIEKQVDDYNKLSQESLKNQDEIRKLEKEIQKRREDAIKKYADFEKDIAETLKAQYQEQVDNLKNKYDSMKEADDDYLDALQEAIEKQRKLRERENQWEDLAQKQKKLSLMQRDTSGANAIETQKLEKEIQKDREQLLDESIDSVIENMQKLAEKQDELRQTEVELKEALLENTMYWNQQAEGVVAGFETAEDYVEWFKRTAVGLNAETGAQFENTMNEARDKFGSASEEIAWRIQDDMSQTGDSVTETITVTGEEIENITKTTSDTFVDEVSNTFERTKKSFNDNMDQAIEKVKSAQQALDEAIKKLNDAAVAANEAAGATRNYLNALMNNNTPVDTGGTMDLGGAGNTEAAKGISNNINSASGADKIAQAEYAYSTYGESIRSQLDIDDSTIAGKIAKTILQGYSFSGSTYAGSQDYSFLDSNENEIKKYAKEFKRGMDSSRPYIYYKFAQGGMVNYTGPAWVDGSPNHPEAFLSADDTERIGNAAKLLSDIPALNRSNISTNSSTYGDTNIEINLNIDHISSDVDVEEMLDRVKQEIVDIARPVGTNVILQQQV